MRRVVIYADRLGLYALRCVEPCQPGGWCMEGAICYLGAASSPELAARMAERWGYVVEAASSSAPASRCSSAAISA